MKLALIASLVAGATAFAPSQQGRASSAVGMSFENEIGVIPPTGYFDPLSLSKGKSQATFDKYRAAELKHGRVAQLAVSGYVAAEIWRWPGEIAFGLPFKDIPNGIAAVEAIPAAGWAQIVAFIGLVETKGYFGDFEAGKIPLDSEESAKRQLQELQNGRLAMLGIAELFRHDLSGGADGLDNLITGLPFLY